MNILKSTYFKFIRILVSFFTKYIAPLHAPWTHKAMTYSHVLTMLQKLEPGDAILTRTNGELSTALIPGYWKHLAIYRSFGIIIDATGIGVSPRYLVDLVLKTDNICILRPKWLNIEERKLIPKNAAKYYGVPYDIEFNGHTTEQLYCSELYYWSINQVKERYLELRERLGVETVTPEDIYLAKSKFELIYEIKDE